MPTRSQNLPASDMSRGHSERLHDHDASNINRNMQHKEALSLRLALGSILGPKRPFTPSASSHSSSGSASPAHPASFGLPASPGMPPPPPTSTPIHPLADGRFDYYLHPRYARVPHTPSRLGHPDSKELHWPMGTSSTSAPSSAPVSPHVMTSQSASPTDECPPVLALPPSVVERPSSPPTLPAPKPVSAPSASAASSAAGSGSGTPKAKFLETLGSNRAWDALIHGSFS